MKYIKLYEEFVKTPDNIIYIDGKGEKGYEVTSEFKVVRCGTDKDFISNGYSDIDDSQLTNAKFSSEEKAKEAIEDFLLKNYFK